MMLTQEWFDLGYGISVRTSEEGEVVIRLLDPAADCQKAVELTFGSHGSEHLVGFFERQPELARAFCLDMARLSFEVSHVLIHYLMSRYHDSQPSDVLQKIVKDFRAMQWGSIEQALEALGITDRPDDQHESVTKPIHPEEIARLNQLLGDVKLDE